MKKKLKQILRWVPLALTLVFLTLLFIKYHAPIIEFLKNSLSTRPYLIALLSGFFSTVSILVPFYTTYPAYAVMVSLLTGNFGNIALIVVLMAAGSVAGDILSYFVVYFPSIWASETKSKVEGKVDGYIESFKEEVMRPIGKKLDIEIRETWQLDFSLAFIFGLLPLPDDLLMIYFGIRRRDLKPILVGSFLGKALMLAAVYLGLFSFSYFIVGGLF